MPMISDKKPIFRVSENDGGQRLDNFLLKRCKRLDKSTCYKLIRKGQIRVNGKRVKPLHKLASGDQVRVPPFVFFVDVEVIDVPADLQMILRQRVIFENTDFLVLNKPAGLPVHTGTGHGYGVIEIINAMPEYKQVQLAHRLDKDTSGCLLLAKNRVALLRFQEAVKRHEVKKTYLAVLQGQLLKSTEVDQPLDTGHRVNGIRHVIVSSSGQSAQTRFKPINHLSGVTLTQCDISTGRTHQIRVHAQYLGHPVLGDRFYGEKHSVTGRKLYLHAHLLCFDAYSFMAPMPQEFDQVMNQC